MGVKSMKKLFAILLVFTMLFTVCACGNQATPGNNTTNTPGTSSGTNTNTNNGGGNTSNSSEPILIGLVDAFSGEKASNGEYTKEGAELFLKEINAKGGVLGLSVKIIYEDEPGNETVATNAYQKLVSQNDVCATVLNKYSSVVLAMSDFVEEAEILLFARQLNKHREKSTNPRLILNPQKRLRLRCDPCCSVQ
jgi:ABC-type branched-subunit amino acid transport system substrate-binding protein